MFRFAMTVCVTAALAGSALAGVNFSDPTSINLLERWNGKTYYYEETCNTPNSLSMATIWKAGVGGLYTPNLAGSRLPDGIPVWSFYDPTGVSENIPGMSDNTPGAYGKIMLDVPTGLGKVHVGWRDYNHTPEWWEIWDDNGFIARGYKDEVTGWDNNKDPHLWTYTISDPNRVSAYLEIRTSSVSNNGFVDVRSIGAYMAADSDRAKAGLAIDGTFNIFREATPTLVSTGRYNNPSDPMRGLSEADIARMFEGNAYDFNPGFDGGDSSGWIEWKLSQEYLLTGAYITKLENHGDLTGLKLWAYDPEHIDNVDGWVLVFEPSDLGNYPGTNDPIHSVFETGYLPLKGSVTSDRFMMTWDNTASGGGREITQFQLFGKAIPEPATMTLLALGGLALLRRRR